MNLSSKLLSNAVEEISKLPGIGKSTALRLALHLVNKEKGDIDLLVKSIKDLKDSVVFCEKCKSISDEKICDICLSVNRDTKTLCVVEDIRDVMAIENTGQFKGLYHVLGGKISPVDGVGPNQLTIDKLIDRVKKNNINQNDIVAKNICINSKGIISLIDFDLAKDSTSDSIDYSEIEKKIINIIENNEYLILLDHNIKNKKN